MYNAQHIRVYLFLAAFVVQWSCARPIELDLPANPSLVAVCHFSADQLFKTTLGFTSSVYDIAEPDWPANAQVVIEDTNGKRDECRYNNGIWKSLITARPGQEYTLTATLEGYPTLSAKSKIPIHIPLEVLKKGLPYIVELSESKSEMHVPLEITPSVLSGDSLYFAFKLKTIVAGELFGEAERLGMYLTDGSTSALLYDTADDLVLIDKKIWTSQGARSLKLEVIIPFNPKTNEKPVSLSLDWRTLSYEYYAYHLSLTRQGGSGSVFSDPDALFNNISGGFGSFSAYSQSDYYLEL